MNVNTIQCHISGETTCNHFMFVFTNFTPLTFSNPNRVEDADSITWPEYEAESKLMINLDDQLSIIKTPDLNLHHQLLSTLYPVRRRKIASDLPTVNQSDGNAKCQRSNGAHTSTVLNISLFEITMILVIHVLCCHVDLFVLG